MAWDFETDPEYQTKLDWVNEFLREEVEPLDVAFPHLPFVPLDETRRKIVDPLKEEVRRQGLWATHLGPELGGQGYGQLKLPLFMMIHGAAVMGLADGPTEVHKTTVARQVLRNYRGTEEMWPTEWISQKLDDARAKYAKYLELEVGNL